MGKRGPTTGYKPEHCNIAYKFCLLGATNEDLAGLFEVSLSTIGTWLARHPEFRKAVQEGRDVADMDVAQSLLNKARGFTHPDVKVLKVDGAAEKVEFDRYFPPDTQAAVFWLRNRRRHQWRERIEHEHSVSEDKFRELAESARKARDAHRR